MAQEGLVQLSIHDPFEAVTHVSPKAVATNRPQGIAVSGTDSESPLLKLMPHLTIQEEEAPGTCHLPGHTASQEQS
jgi:hypothetical protein